MELQMMRGRVAAVVMAAWMLACTSNSREEPKKVSSPEASTLDQQKSALSVLQPEALPRSGFTHTVQGGNRVLIAGGTTNGTSGGIRLAQIYAHLATPHWRDIASMNEGRYDHAAALLSSDRVLVTGGVTSSGNWRSAELYSLTQNTWTSVAPMSIPRVRHTATTLNNGKVLVVGGNNSTSEQGLASAEIFDPVTGIWTTAASPSFPYSEHSATLLSDGRVLVLGNRLQHEIYTPSTNTWARTSDSPGIIGAGHTATVRARDGLVGGEVVVVGSTWVNGSPVGMTYQYLINTSTWITGTSPSIPRRNHQAMQLSNGAVRVLGGVNPSTGTASTVVERFNRNGTWYTEPPLQLQHHAGQASLFYIDQSLVSGGWDTPTDGGAPTRQQTELYTGCAYTGGCYEHGASCGTISDDCGGTLNCGTCASGRTCNEQTHQCSPPPCVPSVNSCAGHCGPTQDNCGGTMDCGPCPPCATGTVWCCSACHPASQCDLIC
ncbi:hypothetical protein D7Y13_17000 [Corallococcus praedator]|uniref:Kelch-like protein n=1 Tax=Corallococcus praedator TaxID=2316724 RepID=A0ABX9QH58_9BACT|nr:MULTISPECIES: kelch repeat-containing protein [Corallococcus]RKH35834.1 hypothetical protein D7X75_02885 [Corallococcus sp. CA031C]RKI07878.1 hypothetical protein D7Y13_17000 [Corallococcus praedator]